MIFNQSHGAPAKYEGNRRVYEIPVNGILLTQFKDEEGLVNHEYFYVDSSGNRTPLKIFLDKDSAKEVGVFRDGTVGVYGNSDDPKSLSYQEFYISDRSELDNYFTLQFQKQFEDKVKQVTGYEF